MTDDGHLIPGKLPWRARAPVSSRYVTDPPSARASGQPAGPQILNVQRLRELYMAGKIDGISVEMSHPNDNLLVATMMAHGMPRYGAEMLRVHPQARFAAYALWVDVQEAARGETGAKERVDATIGLNEDARKTELTPNDPGMSVGLWER